ncbi:unnamed protein product [Meganyctiphanes norvegica]|uniref:DDE-1 domain-containing protein n=1 Tax=Meganyctiphanes norvegica TaxID=48144 RepID=A0AAV2QBC3_MEGNR
MISFMKRNSNRLSTRRRETLKISRVIAEHPTIISEFIDLIKTAYKMAKIKVDNLNDAKRIFTVGETGFRTKAKLNKIIVSRGGNAQVVAPTEGKTNFSVLMCGNAAGKYEPPYVIYKGSDTSIVCGWLLNGPKDASYNTSQSGWMDKTKFHAWIKVFDESIIKKKIQKPVIVIMDGHSSHLDLTVVEEAKSCDIMLVKLPPNSTHILQVLDVSVFGPAKKNWADIIKMWYRQTRDQKITKKVFSALLDKLFTDMKSKPTHLINGFRATGIWPLNKEIILKKIEERYIYKSRRANVSSNINKENSSQSADIGSTAGPSSAPQFTSPPNQNISQNQSVNIDATAGPSSAPQFNSSPDPVISTNLTVLASVVEEVLHPPLDEHSKKAIENTKVNSRMNKKSGEIVTSEEAVAALKIKESKKTKTGKKTVGSNDKRSASQRSSSAKKLKVTDIYSDSEDSVENVSNFKTNDENDLKSQLVKFWKKVSPPHKEITVVGKWYASIYKDSKGKQSLYFGRETKRFLEEAEGKVTNIELDCLKPHVGNSNIIEDYPEGQKDIYLYMIADVFAGPLVMEPYPQRKWNVPNLKEIKQMYDRIVEIDRKALYNSVF